MTVGTLIFTLIICRSGPVLWISILRKLSWGQSALNLTGFQSRRDYGKSVSFEVRFGWCRECQRFTAPHHRLLRFTRPLISYALFSLPVPTPPTPKEEPLIWSDIWVHPERMVTNPQNEDGRIVPKNNTMPYADFTLRERERERKGHSGKISLVCLCVLIWFHHLKHTPAVHSSYL